MGAGRRAALAYVAALVVRWQDELRSRGTAGRDIWGRRAMVRAWLRVGGLGWNERDGWD